MQFDVFYLHHLLRNLQSEILDLGLGMDFGSSLCLSMQYLQNGEDLGDSASYEHKKACYNQAIAVCVHKCVF